MSSSKPTFHLQRVESNGAASPVEVYPVYALPADTQLSRRGLLGTGVTVASLLSMLSAEKAQAQQPAEPKSGKDRGKPATVIYAHPAAVNSLSVTANGRLLASASGDKTVKLWSMLDGRHLRTFGEHGDSVRAVVLAPDSSGIASGCEDKAVRHWTLPAVMKPQTLAGHTYSVRALTITPDSKTLISGSGDKSIKFWTLPGGTLDKTLMGHTDAIRALVVTGDGKMLVSGSGDKTIKLWGLPDGLMIKTLTGHSDRVIALAATPDSKTLASTAEDEKHVSLWMLPDGKHFRRIEAGHGGSIKSLAFSPDGNFLATGSADKTIKIWSVADGKRVLTLTGHAAAVNALVITPDGKTLASGSEDGVIILWDLASGEVQRFLFDPTASKTDAFVYTVKDKKTGYTITYTLPCGSPIPAGATCVCNCVPGTYSPPQYSAANYVGPSGPPNVGGYDASKTGYDPYNSGYDPYGGSYGGGYYGGGSYGGGSYCSCNKICVCIPVCQAHKLLDADPVVRTMAEELLLVMGPREFPYMTWAADRAEPALKTRIGQIMDGIRKGAAPDATRWPSPAACTPYLDSSDEVVGIMAAQMIRHHECRSGVTTEPRVGARVEERLGEAVLRPWFVRGGA